MFFFFMTVVSIHYIQLILFPDLLRSENEINIQPYKLLTLNTTLAVISVLINILTGIPYW